MTDTALCRVESDADLGAVARAVSLAFGGTIEGVREWFAMAGPEHLRACRADDGSIAACLLRVPMGQYFGGVSIPMMGIAGVAVPPERRGAGHALKMMRAAIRDIAAEGIPLSTLYASTQSLYRQAGYEQAGHRFQVRLAISDIGLREHGMEVRPLADGDQPEIERCARIQAAAGNGALDRGPYCWARLKQFRNETHQGFGVFHEGRLEGYLYLAQKRKPETGRHDLSLTDVVFVTPRAGRRLLGLLADFGTIGDEIIFHGGPLHPILTLLPQQKYKVEKLDYWMLRLVDVKAAIERRGYGAGVAVELNVEIADDLIAQNAGAWTLRVGDRRATLVRGAGKGLPTMRVGINGLAAIYSGLYAPAQGVLLGLVSGEEEAIAMAAAAFAGPTPWMTDMF